MSKKNERNCYLFAHRKWKINKIITDTTRLQVGQKKRAEMWALCTRKMKKSKSRESVAPWIENGPKMDRKKRAFYFRKIPDHACFHYLKKHEKKCWCSFFSVHLLVFLDFLKMSKIGKMSEKSCFSKFFLMLCGVFSNIFVLYIMLTIFYFVPQNKNLKKREKKLLKLFFKNEKWTFIFVHFLKIKKSFKK